MWRPSCFSLKHGGGTLGIIKSPVCNYNHRKEATFNHGPLSASHNLMYFFFLSERGGRRRPPPHRSALYTHTTHTYLVHTNVHGYTDAHTSTTRAYRHHTRIPTHAHTRTHIQHAHTNMRTCIHAHIHAHTRAYTHTHEHTCAYIYTRSYSRIHEYTRTYTRTHAHTRSCTRIHTYKCSYTRIHAHTHAHTRAYAHTHAQHKRHTNMTTNIRYDTTTDPGHTQNAAIHSIGPLAHQKPEIRLWASSLLTPSESGGRFVYNLRTASAWVPLPCFYYTF